MSRYQCCDFHDLHDLAAMLQRDAANAKCVRSICIALATIGLHRDPQSGEIRLRVFADEQHNGNYRDISKAWEDTRK